jgi:CRP-like cAMP-binding protein
MSTEVDSLSKVSIFSLMKEEDLERIAKKTQHHLFHEGDVIIREGDRDKRLFIILNGQVEVLKSMGSKNERHLQTLGPHSYFGEMSLIDDLVRSASAVAKGDTQILSLDQWNLRKEIEKCPAMAFELLQMLSRRIRTIEKGMINMIGRLLPICANCKKVRVSDGTWTPIEEYIADRSEAEFSHSICQECAKKLYPHLYNPD